MILAVLVFLWVEGERSPFAVLLTANEPLDPPPATLLPGEHPTLCNPTELPPGEGIGRFAQQSFWVPALRLVRHVLVRIVLLIPPLPVELVLVCGRPPQVPMEVHE